MKIQNILVVYVGNICRSRMVEYFLRQSYRYLQLECAGISGLRSHPADDKTQRRTQQYGIERQSDVEKIKKSQPDAAKYKPARTSGTQLTLCQGQGLSIGALAKPEYSESVPAGAAGI